MTQETLNHALQRTYEWQMNNTSKGFLCGMKDSNPLDSGKKKIILFYYSKQSKGRTTEELSFLKHSHSL